MRLEAFVVASFLLAAAGAEPKVTAADCRMGKQVGIYSSKVVLPESTLPVIEKKEGHFFVLAHELIKEVKVLNVRVYASWFLMQCGNHHHTVMADPVSHEELILTPADMTQILETAQLKMDVAPYLDKHDFEPVHFFNVQGNRAPTVHYSFTRNNRLQAEKTFETDSEEDQITCHGRHMWWRGFYLPYMIGFAAITLESLDVHAVMDTESGLVTLRDGLELGTGCKLHAGFEHSSCFIPTRGNFLVKKLDTSNKCQLRRTTLAPTPGVKMTIPPKNNSYLHLPVRKAHFQLMGEPRYDRACQAWVQETNYKEFKVMAAIPGMVGDAPPPLNSHNFVVTAQVAHSFHSLFKK